MVNKTCKQCQKEFEVSGDDLAFYKKISPEFGGKKFEIPPPTLCPLCRWQRRIVWRNEYNLYKRKCDLSGRDIVARYHPSSPFPVYFVKEWMGDGWDATTYGREFDFNRPFFEQFGELINKVPRQSLLNDIRNDQNSEYTNCAGYSKNCYMIFESDFNEDCYYSRGMTHNKDCSDCIRAHESQLCFESIDISKCYNCFFVQDLDSCSECYFCSNMIGCKYCFGCDGLTRKEYYLYNENVGKEKWDEFMKSVEFTRSNIQNYYNKLEKIRQKVPKRYAKILRCENSQGDHLNNCKNSRFCFDSIKLEDCAYCFEVPNDTKDAMDYATFGLSTNLIYECVSCGYSAYNILFSNETWNSVRNCYYCDSVQFSKNCFGCVGLRRGEHYILNKQYSSEEYEEIVARIIEHMKETGEWGEFFPVGISTFGYNETLANDYFPLDKSAVEALGAKWREDTRLIQYDGPFYEPKESIEEYIGSEQERQALLSGILKCQRTGKPYKIIPQELAFYMKHKLPVPILSFEARHKGRIAKRNPVNLWDRQCDCEEAGHDHEGRCPVKFETTYAPDRPEKVYCEKCYQKEVA